MTDKSTLRENHIWKESMSLANYMYDQSLIITENNPDEKYGVAQRLKDSASNFLYYISQAVSIEKPSGEPYEWRDAKKYAFAMQSMYMLASKQKYISLDPKIMVMIDTLMMSIDDEVEKWQRITLKSD